MCGMRSKSHFICLHGNTHSVSQHLLPQLCTVSIFAVNTLCISWPFVPMFKVNCFVGRWGRAVHPLECRLDLFFFQEARVLSLPLFRGELISINNLEKQTLLMVVGEIRL